MVTVSPSCTVSVIIARYRSKITDCNPPTCIWRPVGADPVGISLKFLVPENYRVPGHDVVCVIVGLALLVEHRLMKL